MSVISKLVTIGKIIFNKDFRFSYLADRGKKAHVSDEEFVRTRYRAVFNKELNLDNPQTYTEKLQWLKLYDHKPEYTIMVDKFEVKKFVAEKIGEQHVIPLLGVWDNVEDINFDTLPDKFVLKTTHDSGSLVICTNKKKLDIKSTKRKLNYYLNRKYYYCNREWPYKNVKPRVIAEQYMIDTTYKELRDYKFFTFGGKPKVLYITQGRGSGESTVADFFDMNFNHLPFTIDHDMAQILPEKPKCFEEMKRLAEILSEGTPQLRVDFYEVNGRVYFGEMTFFHCSGLNSFHPKEWDKLFGEWTILPVRKMENKDDIEKK